MTRAEVSKPKRKAITARMKIQCLLLRAIGQGYAIKCGECGGGIMPDDRIEFDHCHFIAMGGPHNYENLRPLHYSCHQGKTARDLKANAKVKRLRGETCNGPKRKIRSRGFDKTRTRKFSGDVVRRT